MLKIVPDPPHKTLCLEDTLIQATDYALCAATVVHQAILLQPKSPASILMWLRCMSWRPCELCLSPQ